MSVIFILLLICLCMSQFLCSTPVFSAMSASVTITL